LPGELIKAGADRFVNYLFQRFGISRKFGFFFFGQAKGFSYPLDNRLADLLGHFTRYIAGDFFF